MGLGDAAERALEMVGVTPELVQRWLGEVCFACEERKQRLNQFSYWVARTLRGKPKPAEALREMLGDSG